MIKPTDQIKVDVSKEGPDITISLKGTINEDAKFVPLEGEDSKRLIFDLEQIALINSCGLRNWVQWMAKESPHSQVVYKKCPKQLVDQINILEGFMPRGAIMESFYVPYYCESCGFEENFLAKRGTDYKEGSADSPEELTIPLVKTCPKCEARLEADIVPDKYFKFLKYRP